MTMQVPIISGFGPQTTAKEILANRDLTGKIAIVTGGYSGVGLETTRALANAGATVVVPARTSDKARSAVEGITNVELEELDLMYPQSIDSFASRFLASNRPLHILINCAGVMSPWLRKDARGYESMFATNHLGHFQLTARLWPALEMAHGARVVAVSSLSHHNGRVVFDDPNFERREFDMLQAYGQSKSAISLFAIELDKRGEKCDVRAFAVHPGVILETGLGRDLRGDSNPNAAKENSQSSAPELDPIQFKNAEQGAATGVWCATSDQLDGMGGVYCVDCDIANAVPPDSSSTTGVRPWAIDPELAQRLWALSEELIGIKFEI
ncbi:MAG TPA: SDR family NAD(P)-dependent oxidoreductase [Anaerovoracaceae bacterium]|nr:SDR family NAD(P)-dependent oxidoreductase [Anaerovoracaceae bacterium]